MNPLKNRWGLLATALTVIALGGALVLVLVPAPKAPFEVATSTSSGQPGNTASTSAATSSPTGGQTGLSDQIVVDYPQQGAMLSSGSTTITGKARGSWYFEATFPVYLTDWDGKIIAQGQAHAEGDWMTSDFVPFTATLTYTKPQAGDPSHNRGTVILRNDNPSGDPSRDKALEIPVYFQ